MRVAGPGASFCAVPPAWKVPVRACAKFPVSVMADPVSVPETPRVLESVAAPVTPRVLDNVAAPVTPSVPVRVVEPADNTSSAVKCVAVGVTEPMATFP